MGATTGMDANAAGRKDSDLPVLLVVVTDIMTVPGKPLMRDERYFRKLADYGILLLQARGVDEPSVRRVTMLGRESVEVNGNNGDISLWVRAFEVGRRRFEFRCYAELSTDDWPCEPAVGTFEISQMPDEVAATDTPHVLHLRDERFGISFDAPDDTWLAIGPRAGGGSAQVVWLWVHDQRQIDIQALDLSWIAQHPTEAMFAELMADRFRHDDTKVVLKKSTLAGQSCHYFEIDRSDGAKQDMFILFRNEINYTLLVTEPARDAAFIAHVKQRLRLR